MKRFFILFFLILTACSGGAPSLLPAAATETPPPPSATPLEPTATTVPMALSVNGEGISLDEFNAELERYRTAMSGMGREATPEQATKVVQEDLASQLLLEQGAVEAGFRMDEAVLKSKLDDLRAKIGGPEKLIAWEQAHGYSEESFARSLFRSAAGAWMRDKIMATVPANAEQVHIRQILLYNEDVAKNYYSLLQSGADFDQLAAEVDPLTRGDIGWFPHGYLQDKAVEDAAFSLEIGAYSAIIPSNVGFHILKLLERQPDRGLSPDALSVLQTRALNDWLATRRQQSNIVFVP